MKGEPAKQDPRALPRAIVMNMFYTGLGIARSLGEHGVPVLGLTSRHGVYGNFTRYAKVMWAPDSLTAQAELLAFLLALGRRLGTRSVIFPTRDHDVVFLDRFREQLAESFSFVVPERGALSVCLDKWETYRAAQGAGVPAPKCWVIEGPEEVKRIAAEAVYPCVLKPLAAHQWRQGDNWGIVGARKAIPIDSETALIREYAEVARAATRVLLQQMIPGGDDCLRIAACYMDRQSRWIGGFNTQKLVQVPEGFGTGCVVQSADLPELRDRTERLLQAIGFSGVAEVEYKWDAAEEEYKLIEINPRPWDQHRLGKACGVDLMYLAYCEHAGLPMPQCSRGSGDLKWIAEDTLFSAALRMMWKRDPRLRFVFRQARGKRIFAIWSPRDPLPLMAYLAAGLIPELVRSAIYAVKSAVGRLQWRKQLDEAKGLMYEKRLEKRNGVS